MTGLEEFIRQDDRQEEGRARFFTGRRRELDGFADAVEFALAGQTSGKTLVFQGAPGAGKTALMRECAAVAEQRGCMAAGIEPDQLTSVDGLFKEVQENIARIAPDVAKRAVKFLTNLAQRGITVQGLGFGAGVGPRRAEALDAVSKFKELAKAWRGLTIVLLVDEAQSIPETEVSRAIVKYLHAGAKESSILLACFGLSDTAAKLAGLGVSRTSLKRVHNMAAMTIEEAEQAIGKAFVEFSVTGPPNEAQSWLGKLAQASQGWPQHLVVLMKAALRELSHQDMDVTQGSLERALAEGEAGKKAYYAARLAQTGDGVGACRAVACALRDKPSIDKLSIKRAAAPHLAEWGLQFADFLHDAVHAGVLSPVAPDRYAVPIPSFADYLRNDASPPKAEAGG